MIKRIGKVLALFIVLMVLLGTNVFAGTLGTNENGIYYLKDDGTLAISEWVEIDDNMDGISDSYYFNEAGFMVIDTITPDGYKVGADGKYIKSNSSNIYVPDKDSDSYKRTFEKQAASAKKIREKRKKNKEKQEESKNTKTSEVQIKSNKVNDIPQSTSKDMTESKFKTFYTKYSDALEKMNSQATCLTNEQHKEFSNDIKNYRIDCIATGYESALNYNGNYNALGGPTHRVELWYTNLKNKWQNIINLMRN